MSFDIQRQALATAISSAADYQTFAYPPETVLPKMVCIAPGSPYLEPWVIGKKGFRLNLSIHLYANTADNQGELIMLETMIEKVILALPTWAEFRDVSTVQEVTVGTANLTRVVINVTTAISLEE